MESIMCSPYPTPPHPPMTRDKNFFILFSPVINHFQSHWYLPPPSRCNTFLSRGPQRSRAFFLFTNLQISDIYEFCIPWQPGPRWWPPGPRETRVRRRAVGSGRTCRRCRTSWASLWSTLRWCSSRLPLISTLGHGKESEFLYLAGALVAHRIECVPYRLSPDHSDPGLIPDRGHLLHVLSSISHTFLSISLYHNHA